VTLAGLSRHRPLGEILGDLLRLAAGALGAPHGVLALASAGGPDARAGRGAWEAAPAGTLEIEAATAEGPRRLASDPASRPGVGAVLTLPVRVGERGVGAIGLGLDPGSPAGFAGDAVALLRRFAAVAAVAFENERLVAAAQRSLRSEKALRAATQALTATLRLEDVLSTILSELQNVVPHDTASVQELRGDRMVIVGGRDIDLEVFLGHGFPAFGGRVPNSDVLRLRRPVVVPDILGDHPYPDFPHEAHALSGVRSWLGVPLLFGNQCTGMLTLDKLEPGFFDETHAETAMAFAAQAAVALENARLYEQSRHEVEVRGRAEEELREANARLQAQIAEVEALQGRLREQAIRDPLTRLFNRRYFSETLQRELARCRREGRPLCIALLDLDHFKEVNDAHGHDAGDRVLEAFGRFLLERTREGDVACRYGGEEFIVVLPGAAGPAACARAESWRADLHDFPIPHSGRGSALTMSIGVAEFPTPAQTADQLIRLADVALYQAKREGRDRVVLAR
jgi:diguanylate cyclase (GGDEF)-like protein